jgi:adenylosuccinate synthase
LARVGGGPFPSELEGEPAARLRGTGELPWDEFGTTTGRPRRVGWLDLVILRHAAQINGLSDLALTKLDILTDLPQVPVCIAYEIDGERTTSFPSSSSALERCRPIYETLPGWSQDITLTRSYEELPANARRYVDFVAETVGVPINLVSVGPGRDQVIQV